VLLINTLLSTTDHSDFLYSDCNFYQKKARLYILINKKVSTPVTLSISEQSNTSDEL
jgi:hypothetical protein